MPIKDRDKRLASQREHYQAHKEEYFARNRESVARKRAYIRQQKDNPCTDCGIKYPYYVMDFDHKGEKLFNIGWIASQSWKQIYAELAKCDLVCSNCHRERSHRRRVED